ncbi:MATE family efflux transporter [Aquincola sp. MAHUQ-54]|uniref:MATE family efflux transporter n=1 Tax=Aquincola agrisoli TaxID=3119538 RepID=A0AAW9QD69_9BURK
MAAEGPREGRPPADAPRSLREDARRIARLAWPLLVGQLAVLAFGTIDTMLVARYAAADLAALAVGGAAYITVFIGLMGVVLALGPIVGQLYGARRLEEAGAQLHQAVWLALGLSVVGSTLLAFPQPFLLLARATPDVADKVRGYTGALALSLPAALLFTAYRGFNTAVSRPKAVTALQLGGLALKLPLSFLFVYGAGPVAPMGVAGCGLATCIAMWAQFAAAVVLLRRDPFYAPFRLWGHGLRPPSRPALAAQLRLGIPMGLSIGIEVTGFTFMAFFISRLSPTAVAGHQIAANLVAMMYMLPLSLANATSTLVAQSIGAGAMDQARRLGWRGLGLGAGLAAAVGLLVLVSREWVVRAYTADPVIVAAALPLLAWVAVFHMGDAMQCLASFVLRAYRIATVPLLIYASAIWGIGLGGGYALVFGWADGAPAAVQGAPGFWAASTAGLVAAALGLVGLLAWVQRQRA